MEPRICLGEGGEESLSSEYVLCPKTTIGAGCYVPIIADNLTTRKYALKSE